MKIYSPFDVLVVNKFVGAGGANHLASVMHSELKQPARVMLFPLVGICYNISL